MLKTIPTNHYSDDYLRKLNPNRDINELRAVYNPVAKEEGIFLTGLNFSHRIEKGVKFYKHALFSLKDGDISGVYDYLSIELEDYTNLLRSNDDILDDYGVCDNVEQVIDLYKLDKIYGNFSIALTPIFKNEQPESGGWRWHKWGRYIGEHEATCEYLYDEANIEQVYVYKIVYWED